MLNKRVPKWGRHKQRAVDNSSGSRQYALVIAQPKYIILIIFQISHVLPTHLTSLYANKITAKYEKRRNNCHIARGKPVITGLPQTTSSLIKLSRKAKKKTQRSISIVNHQ